MDPIQASKTNSDLAKRLAAKQTELAISETNLNTQKQKVDSAGRQAIQHTADKNERDVVQISKEGEQAVERTRGQYSLQVKDLQNKNQDHFLRLSQETADKMKALDQEMAKQLSNRQSANLEKLAFVDTRAEDSFYRLKSFDATVSEQEDAFKLVIKLPAHEAQNLFVTANGRDLKLSLARSYEARQSLEDGRANRTYSYQTILEQINLPAKVDPSGMTREYADGALTIRFKKNI